MLHLKCPVITRGTVEEDGKKDVKEEEKHKKSNIDGEGTY